MLERLERADLFPGKLKEDEKSLLHRFEKHIELGLNDEAYDVFQCYSDAGIDLTEGDMGSYKSIKKLQMLTNLTWVAKLLGPEPVLPENSGETENELNDYINNYENIYWYKNPFSNPND